jgi:hypothetical protein
MAGITVRVALTISGTSGRVISARALEPHADTPLGQCVAQAVKHQAKFSPTNEPLRQTTGSFRL